MVLKKKMSNNTKRKWKTTNNPKLQSQDPSQKDQSLRQNQDPSPRDPSQNQKPPTNQKPNEMHQRAKTTSPSQRGKVNPKNDFTNRLFL
jgi:hypothetical protein